MNVKPKTIINIALKIERGGERFYNLVAEKIKDEDISDLFKLFASEEIRHVQSFKDIGRKIAQYNVTDSVEIITRENSIINAISSSLIDKASEKMQEYSKRIKSKIDAIDAAIGFEKDTILFYYEIMDLFQQEDIRNVLNRIINEERKHILKLMATKRKLVS